MGIKALHCKHCGYQKLIVIRLIGNTHQGTGSNICFPMLYCSRCKAMHEPAWVWAYSSTNRGTVNWLRHNYFVATLTDPYYIIRDMRFTMLDVKEAWA